jgi:hypothetical protein
MCPAMSEKGKVQEISGEELAKRLGKGSERRTEPRVAAKLEIDIPIATSDELRRVYTENISKGGLLFTIQGPASIPAELNLKLSLPGGKTVVLTGEVRHVAPRAEKEFEVGVQFKLEADVQKTLDQAIGKM